MAVQELPLAAAAARGVAGTPAPLLHADVAGYALEHGLVTAAQIARGDLRVRNLSSRNRVYALESREGSSLLLKQGVGQMGAAMIANEARAYAMLDALGPGVRRHLPAWRSWDEGRGIVALGLLSGARSLRTVHGRGQRAPLGPARSLGRALGRLHRATMRHGAARPTGWAPAGLQLHRPGVELLREGSAAAVEVVKIIQRTPGFSEHIEDLRRGWCARAFVHVDVKWDNCLMWGSEHRRLALVDWEAACLGEPCWDIGSALGHYLSAWVFSVPVTGRTPPERFAAIAQRPLSGLQPAIRACWESYVGALGLSRSSTPAWLFRTVRFAAVRLALTAFEAAQASPQLTAPLVLHMQLAFNMLERPHEAAVHLLGLPLEGAEPA